VYLRRCLFFPLNPRLGDHLLVEGGDVHVKTPTHPGEHMRPSGQPGWQTVDGGFFPAIHHPADAPLGVDPVQAAIFVAGILCPNLVLGLHPPELPVNIIGRANVGTHKVILL